MQFILKFIPCHSFVEDMRDPDMEFEVRNGSHGLKTVKFTFLHEVEGFLRENPELAQDLFQEYGPTRIILMDDNGEIILHTRVKDEDPWQYLEGFFRALQHCSVSHSIEIFIEYTPDE